MLVTFFILSSQNEALPFLCEHVTNSWLVLYLCGLIKMFIGIDDYIFGCDKNMYEKKNNHLVDT